MLAGKTAVALGLVEAGLTGLGTAAGLAEGLRF
jgi:hypothetical protein